MPNDQENKQPACRQDQQQGWQLRALEGLVRDELSGDGDKRRAQEALTQILICVHWEK